MSDTFVKQHGGQHYQAEYQHWDWATDISMLYLIGTATKYLPRWRVKGGIDDLFKVKTYLEKSIKCWDTLYSDTIDPPDNVDELTEKFIQSNNLGEIEARICKLLCDLYTDEDCEGPKLSVVLIDQLIAAARQAAG